MEYNDWDKRRPSKLILKEILEKSADIYGIKVESREQEEGPPSGKPINIELSSSDSVSYTHLTLPKICNM